MGCIGCMGAWLRPSVEKFCLSVHCAGIASAWIALDAWLLGCMATCSTVIHRQAIPLGIVVHAHQQDVGSPCCRCCSCCSRSCL